MMVDVCGMVVNTNFVRRITRYLDAANGAVDVTVEFEDGSMDEASVDATDKEVRVTKVAGREWREYRADGKWISEEDAEGIVTDVETRVLGEIRAALGIGVPPREHVA